MEGRSTAVYALVRMEELKPEEGGSYQGPLAKQEEACLQYLKKRSEIQPEEPVEVCKNLNQLLMDVERRRSRRLEVSNLDRLGGSQEEREGILFELNAAGVELLAVTE